MNTSPQSEYRTRMFARVVGPFLALVTATAAVRLPDLHPVIAGFGADPLWGWIGGAFTLLAGLVVVALHPYWRGAAAIIISVAGWLSVVKGFMLMAFPDALTSVADTAINAPNWWRPVYVVFALLGVYVTYVGWVPEQNRPAPKAVKLTPPDRRAA